MKNKKRANLQVLPTNSNSYLVRNTKTNTEYTVLPLIENLECNCSDYRKSIACNHVFAVLKFLGFSSIAEYQEYVEEEMIARLEESKKIESEYLELEGDKDYLK
jgi:hypothetical protein